MAIIRGTTPTCSITIDGVDLTDVTEYKIYITIDQNGTQITKNNFDNYKTCIASQIVDETSGEVTGTLVDVYLTQEETLLFDVGVAEVQPKWIDSSGIVTSTDDIATITLSRALLESVISYS